MAPAKRSEVPVEPIEAGFRRVDPPAAWDLGSDASVALFAAAAFETSPDALMLVEADGVIALANSAAEGMFGLSLSQLVGRGVETLLPERLRFAHKLHRRGFATAPRDRAMGAGRELAAVRANGEEFPVEIQLTPYEAHGRAFVVTMVRDVSERRKAEAEARERQWRLQIVLDQLPIVYWTTDCDLVYTSSIGAGLHELGLVENEAVGKPLTALFPSDDQHVEAHRLALTGVPTSHMIEYRGRLLHGHVEPYRDANGAIIGTVGSAYDLTEQKHALDAAAESERYARAVLDATTARTAVLDAGGHIVATNRAWRKGLPINYRLV
jgi:PAS domain S-box-containing protein